MGVKECLECTHHWSSYSPEYLFFIMEANSPCERCQQHRKQHLLRRTCQVCIRDQPHRKKNPISRAKLCQQGWHQGKFYKKLSEAAWLSPCPRPHLMLHACLDAWALPSTPFCLPSPTTPAPTLYARLITLSVTLGTDWSEVSAQRAHPAEPWLGFADLLLSEVSK